MGVGTFVWFDLAAAVVLAVWILVRHPQLGPRSLRWAALLVVLGQVVAQIGVPLIASVEQLPHGVQLALVVVLPALFCMVLSSLWLVRAFAEAIGGDAPSHSARHR